MGGKVFVASLSLVLATGCVSAPQEISPDSAPHELAFGYVRVETERQFMGRGVRRNLLRHGHAACHENKRKSGKSQKEFSLHHGSCDSLTPENHSRIKDRLPSSPTRSGIQSLLSFPIPWDVSDKTLDSCLHRNDSSRCNEYFHTNAREKRSTTSQTPYSINTRNGLQSYFFHFEIKLTDRRQFYIVKNRYQNQFRQKQKLFLFTSP